MRRGGAAVRVRALRGRVRRCGKLASGAGREPPAIDSRRRERRRRARRSVLVRPAPDAGRGPRGARRGKPWVGTRPRRRPRQHLRDDVVGGSGRKGDEVRKAGCACSPTVLASKQQQPFAIAVDATTAYWVNSFDGTAAACAIDGCDNQPRVIGTGPAGPVSLAIDDANVYWGSSVNGPIGACPLSGCLGAPRAVVPQGTRSMADAIVASDDALFWSTFGDLLTCRKSGCAAPTLLASHPTELAVSIASRCHTDLFQRKGRHRELSSRWMRRRAHARRQHERGSESHGGRQHHRLLDERRSRLGRTEVAIHRRRRKGQANSLLPALGRPGRAVQGTTARAAAELGRRRPRARRCVRSRGIAT